MLYGALGGAMLYGAAARTAVWRGAQARRLGLNCEAAAAARPYGRCGGRRWRAAVSGETLLAEMDRIYMDSNAENDNTEHIRGKRLSSILKAPRNPLDDLGSGNELTQDLNTEKRRKSSRRVSFANTINCRVFHRDLKNNAAERENEECTEDTENHVLLNQHEEPEAVPCEITGMNTLLHAPIQSPVQQTECHDVDNAIMRTDRPNTTLIFSDENEMDMTTSHTAVISRNLKNSETDKTEKIDIVSFLAELNSISGKAETSKDFHFSFDAADRFCPSFEQKEDATTGKKINSNEFSMNLSSNEKALNPMEGPEKENIFFVPSQVSENTARSSVEYVYSHEQLATCNVTKIFREQGDGMEMTKCQASDIQNMRSSLCEAPTGHLPSADVTQAFADGGMDMTTNHTAKIHFPFAAAGNQNLNFKRDFSSMELDNYIVKRTSHQQLIIKQDLQLCTSKKMVNVEDSVDAMALRAFKQETRTLSSIPGSVSSETVFRDDKTVVFSQCDDMEITGNYTDVLYNESTRGMNSSCHKAFEKPVNRNSLLVERRHSVNNDNTRSLSLDDRTSLSCKNSACELSSGSDGQNERVTQDPSPASLNPGFNSCTNSVSTSSSKGRLQHRLANSLLVSLPGEKTAVFSGTDMNLTKNCVGKGYRRNTENEFPPGMSNSITCKPHFLDSRSVPTDLQEQEKMEITKCQTVVSGDQSIGITAEAKQMHCQIIPSKSQNSNISDAACSLDRDKENLETFFERGILISKTVSSEGGFNNPQSGDDLRLRGVEERSQASNSKQLTGSSQFLEKSVVFPSGENMDLTENCAAVAPDQDICTILPGRKAAAGHTEDKSKTCLKKEAVVTNSQEQPGCDMYPMVSDKKMLTVTGTKHLLSADEKTTVFSEGADMDITGNHTVSAHSKTILQPKILNNDISFVPEDKTCVFTQNNDMEISRLDPAATVNSMEKAVSQGMLSRTNGTRRKSLKGTIGEKTVLFSLSENNDMSITEGLTAAISHEIVSQNEVGLPSPSSAHPVRTVTFTSNQADIDIKSCSASKTTVKIPCDDVLILDKVVGREVPSNKEATMFAMDDMEITKAHNVSLKENLLQGRQPNQSVPLTSSIMFTSDQADMEMTEYHPVDGGIERDLCEDRLNLPTQVAQEALSGSKTVIFPLAENMDITKTHAVLSGEIGVWNGRPIPAVSAVPADKTTVFCHNQDDMEITSSHTVAVNNNTEGPENQEASRKSTQQPDLHSASLSSHRDEVDSLQVKDLNGEDHKKSNAKPSISSASSASALPTEKGPIKVHGGAIPDAIYTVSIQKDALDVQALQDLGLSTENSIPVSNEQDLLHSGTMKSGSVSFKLPGNDPLDGSEESGVVVSHVILPAQHSDSLKGPPDALSTQRSQVLKDDSSGHEDLATDLAMDGAGIVPVSSMESEENVLSAEVEATGFQMNSEQTKQLSDSDSLGDLAPKLSGILNICSKLENIRRKSVVVSKTALSDHLLKLPSQPEDTLCLERNNLNEQRLCYAKEQENACLESGAAPTDANLGMALKDKYKGRNIPLGIFQPKLPSRRNPSVSSVQDINTKSSGKVESPVPEVNLNAIKAAGYDSSSRQNFSPSQFIAEEFLPVCPEEMDSNDSVSSEFVEEACSNRNKREISHNEKIQVEETKSCNNAKRVFSQVEEDLQSLKKLKMDEILVDGTSQDVQVTYGTVPDSQAEVAESEDSPNPSAKNPDCTHASSSNPLDSVKADTELTIQRSSQMESQLLTDSICEDNLWEKFQSGVITVGEFFTLVQVHIPIQKPRQSHIPASCAVSAPPTPEDLILSQYVYRPKLRIYEEDCQVLSQMIDDLKQYVSVQDQPLVNVNKSLWEVMKTCSDEELKSFGAELNKMKSYFIKESKILAHNEKEALYSKLLQSAQEQYEKLQTRIANMDELLQEAESCLADLEADSEWKGCETDCSDDEMEGEDSESRKLEEELGSLKAQEEELQRELSDLETENEQILAQMKQLQENEKSCQELLERCNFTEWEISEWSERQAVFSFLHDSIELTVVFGTPVDGDVFGEHPSRKIVSLSFESLLDEEKAPPSSRLVQRLIFQFIESQGCWQEKCPTLQYLPQVLHDVSLVVSRCRILGEEIAFLERWGGKYNLLKTDIIDTNVKLLFSTSTAFVKFELTLSVSSNYPSSSLPFTVEKKIGNIGHEEISAVLTKVPIGYHYLRRMVSLIHQNLLQDPR